MRMRIPYQIALVVALVQICCGDDRVSQTLKIIWLNENNEQESFSHKKSL